MRDERYTTVIANRIMRETGVKQSKKKGMVDQIAAEILLQDYLNHCIK
jgi:putative Holliday junction resolvase